MANPAPGTVTSIEAVAAWRLKAPEAQHSMIAYSRCKRGAGKCLQQGNNSGILFLK